MFGAHYFLRLHVGPTTVYEPEDTTAEKAGHFLIFVRMIPGVFFIFIVNYQMAKKISV